MIELDSAFDQTEERAEVQQQISQLQHSKWGNRSEAVTKLSAKLKSELENELSLKKSEWISSLFKFHLFPLVSSEEHLIVRKNIYQLAFEVGKEWKKVKDSMQNEIKFFAFSILFFGSSQESESQLISSIRNEIDQLHSLQFFEEFDWISRILKELKSSSFLSFLQILVHSLQFNFLEHQIEEKMEEIVTSLSDLQKEQKENNSFLVSFQSCIQSILRSNQVNLWFDVLFRKTNWDSVLGAENKKWIDLLYLSFSFIHSSSPFLNQNHLQFLLKSFQLPEEMDSNYDKEMELMMEMATKLIQFGNLSFEVKRNQHNRSIPQISLPNFITSLICRCVCFSSFSYPLKGEEAEDSWVNNFRLKKQSDQLLELIWEKCDLNPKKEEKGMEEKIKQLLSLQSIEIMEMIYSKLLPLSVSDKRGALYVNEDETIGWKKNFADRNGMFWFIKQLKNPFVGGIAQKGIAVSLAVLNDYSPMNKRRGGEGLNYLMKELSDSEIRWFAELTFLHISSNLPLVDDPLTLQYLLSAAQSILSVIEFSFPKPKSHSLFELILSDVEKRIGRPSQYFPCFSVLLDHLNQLVLSIEIETLKHFKSLMPILYQILSWIGDSFQLQQTINEKVFLTGQICLRLLQSICVQCWPRIPAHKIDIENCLAKFQESVETNSQFAKDSNQSFKNLY